MNSHINNEYQLTIEKRTRILQGQLLDATSVAHKYIFGAIEDAIIDERDKCIKVIDEKLRSIMAGNYSYLVDSYISQLTKAVREMK